MLGKGEAAGRYFLDAACVSDVAASPNRERPNIMG
jgi:hypothetical protein